MENKQAATQAVVELKAANWTNGGAEVLIVRMCGKDGSSSHGWKYPLTVGEQFDCPDWKGVAECGGGFHGWPWGLSLGDGADPDYSKTWMVFGAKPEDVIDLGGKVKAKTGIMRRIGTWQSAFEFVLSGQMGYAVAKSEGVGHATGDQSAAICTGLNSRAKTGKFGCIALAWWNEKERRGEMRCAEIGVGDGSDGKLKADTFYRLDEAGQFIEAL
jgi:hypothetical protein